MDVTGSKDTLDGGLGGSGDGDDVAVLVSGDLAGDELGRWDVADGVEETVDVELLGLLGLHVLDGEGLQEFTVTAGLGGNCVPEDSDLGVRDETLGHDLGSAELVTADEDVDVGGVLCQVGCLLGRRVTTADNGKRLVAEDGDSAVTDGTGRDTALPVSVLSWEEETLS